MTGFTKGALIRPENFPADTYKEGKIGNLTFHTPVNDRYNYETPPPALTKTTMIKYYRLGIFPQWKDPDCVHKGFYTRALSDEERETLGKMIENLQQ